MLEKIMDLLSFAQRQKNAVYVVGDFFRNFFDGFSFKKIFAGFMAIIEMFGCVLFDSPVTARG